MTDTVPYREPSIVAANGIRLCYDAFGDPAATPLVLVMGLAAQMIVWDDEFCADLASRGYFVVRFDNRDIGKSTHFDGARVPGVPELLFAGTNRIFQRPVYTLVEMARDVTALMDVLGTRRAHVAGVSMGGAIAQELAIHFRGRVRSITSIMSTTGDAKLPRPDPAALRVLLSTAPKDEPGYVARFVDTWRLLSGPVFPIDLERTTAQARACYARGINVAGPRRQLLAIICSGDRTKALGGLTTPTLVMHGTSDPLVPAAGGRATAAAVPGARLIELAGMGHALPRVLWPQIIREIAEHAAAADLATAG